MIPHWGINSNPVLNAAGFFAPLKSSIALVQGVGAPTFTRATTATVTDFEGNVHTALTGEARFTGARRVENILLATENFAAANWGNAGVVVTVGQTDSKSGTAAARFDYAAVSGAGNYRIIYQATSTLASKSTVFAMDVKGAVGGETVWLMYTPDGVTYASTKLVLTTSYTRYFIPANTTGSSPQYWQIGVDLRDLSQTPTPAQSIYVCFPQVENVTGQSNSNPSEYVSNGVLLAPYHGAGVDGVQYFEYRNGNTFSGNVVTAGFGAPIADATLQGYLEEPAVTNYFLNSGTPATQTISLGVGTYTTSLLGTGSITSSAGTATATGYGAATSITPNTIVVTVAGTVVFTVTGTVTNPQVENNVYPTSYIATAGTAVTRNADVLTVQVAGNINLSVGSVYGEMSVLSLGNSFGALAVGGTANIQFNRLQSSTIFNSYDGVNNPTFNTGPFSNNTRYKTAISWGGANMYGTIGGAAVVSGPFKGSFTSDTSIAIGGTGAASLGGHIRNVRIWQAQLPNATLQAITV